MGTRRLRTWVLGVSLTCVLAAAIALAAWAFAGPVTAHPGNTCNPPAGHGRPGCHVSPTPTTAKPKATTTTAKRTATTAKPATTAVGANLLLKP